MKKIKFNSGQTLMEVLFAVGVVAVCLVGLMIAIVAAVRNAKFAKNTSLANKYVQETMEELRKQRDRSDWEIFKGLGDSCTTVDIFNKCIKYENPNEETRQVTVTVSWEEGGRTHEAEAVTFFTKWGK